MQGQTKIQWVVQTFGNRVRNFKFLLLTVCSVTTVHPTRVCRSVKRSKQWYTYIPGPNSTELTFSVDDGGRLVCGLVARRGGCALSFCGDAPSFRQAAAQNRRRDARPGLFGPVSTPEKKTENGMVSARTSRCLRLPRLLRKLLRLPARPSPAAAPT
jgi:hypothetical protein